VTEIFQEDFYEFLLYAQEGDKTINKKLIELGVANKVQGAQLPLCLSYPSFNMLERLEIYPTFGERCWMLEKHHFNFTSFENCNIPPVTNTFAFESELCNILKNPSFSTMREVFLKTLQIEGSLQQ
jgi:hypothetical protein